MSITEGKLTSLIAVGLETLVVEITDYIGNKEYDNSIFVECDNKGLVLHKSDLSLVGFSNSARSDLSPHGTNDVMHADVLEAEYGFLRVAKEFLQGKRGTHAFPGEVIDLYKILSPHTMKYCEFVVFSHSDASPEEIRARLYSLIGGIVCSLDEKTLQTITSKKNGISLLRFLLVALQKNTSLYFERNPVTC